MDNYMNVILQRLPVNLQELREMPEMELTAPENTCAMFLVSLYLYLKDKKAGTEVVNLLRGPRPMTTYDEQFLRDRLRDKAYLPLAYFEGASPENNYTPEIPYVLEVLEDMRPQDVEPGYVRLYLKTEGADSPRPVKLRQKERNGTYGNTPVFCQASVFRKSRIPGHKIQLKNNLHPRNRTVSGVFFALKICNFLS